MIYRFLHFFYWVVMLSLSVWLQVTNNHSIEGTLIGSFILLPVVLILMGKVYYNLTDRGTFLLWPIMFFNYLSGVGHILRTPDDEITEFSVFFDHVLGETIVVRYRWFDYVVVSVDVDNVDIITKTILDTVAGMKD
jgi:hypothetical protein